MEIIHFLERYNLRVRRIYPKMMQFLSDERDEHVIKQYLESTAKNETISLNSYLRNNLAVYCFSNWYCTLCWRKETFAARKEMVGVFIGYRLHYTTSVQIQSFLLICVFPYLDSFHGVYFDLILESFMLDFISLVSVSSLKSEILIEKVK